jgi:hypothetical protein
MSALALPLLRSAALFGITELHPILSQVARLGTALLVRAAGLGLVQEPWCDPDECHGPPPCPFEMCMGSGGCSPSFCNPAYIGCESGGTCWTTSNLRHCCDCFCCDAYFTWCALCICGNLD